MVPCRTYMSNIITLLKITDLLKKNSCENFEDFVIINKISPYIICEYIKFDMKEYLGDSIVVRKTVAEKLIKISKNLNEKFPGYKLKVVYGYRHPNVQLKYFENKKSELQKINIGDSEDELNEKTHMFVADPRVAGHPTGGAVDITITTPNGDLDMGTKIADFSNEEKIKSFSFLINDEQKRNRKLLHDLMISEGFAPFYGEWWHFSYGDLEWASFYDKNSSIYFQKEYYI